MPARDRSLISITLVTLLALLSAGPLEGGAQAVVASSGASTIFIVRHAERADAPPAGQPRPSMTPPAGAAGGMMMARADPALSPAGEARAQRLGAMLAAAGITRVFATEFRRTQQTAAPTARAAGIDVVAVPADDTSALLARLAEPGGPALVVGHSNTVPDLIKALGVQQAVAIGDAEYDNLFIIVKHAGDAHLVNLKFE